eukprot:1640194-Pleurochrysis_carterae.AAC.1
MYTDDIVLAAVGAEHIVALLRAWHQVTRRVGLAMAIPEKGKRVHLFYGLESSSSLRRGCCSCLGTKRLGLLTAYSAP